MELRKSKRIGFTLVELLVVIAIIGVLVALLLPAIQSAREASRRSQCGSNLKQIGIGLLNYHDTMKVFPPALLGSGRLRQSSWPSLTSAYQVKNTTGWVMLLPFIEQQAMHSQYNFDVCSSQGKGDPDAIGTVIGNSTINQKIYTQPLPIFTCPSDEMPASVFNNAVGTSDFYESRDAARSNYLFNTAAYEDRSAPYNYQSLNQQEKGVFGNDGS